MGGRAIADHLNAHGYAFRGRKFFNSISPGYWPGRITSGGSLRLRMWDDDTNRQGRALPLLHLSCADKKRCGVMCPSVRAEQLDELVIRKLVEKLFVNDRLEGLLQRVLDSSDEARGRKLDEITRCEDGIAISRRRLSVLYEGIEAETLSARDPDIAARIKSHRAEIEALNQTAKTLRQQVERGSARITPAAVQRFGEIACYRLISGDQPERQQMVRAFVKQVRVGPRQVTIHGEKDALAHGVAVVARSTGAVPIFDREWCRLQDSNLWPHHYE